jgi:hypothetical protein
MPAPSTTNPATTLVRWWRTGGWYVVVAALTTGFAAPVAFVHAAVRSRAVDLWAWAIAYTTAVVSVFVLFSMAPQDAAHRATGPLPGLATALIFLIWFASSFHLAAIRRRVFGLRPVATPLPDGAYRDDPAVAAALERRQRRNDARRLAGSDPLLARELGIGRPDLRRGYDDGGLVELNTAPAPVLAAVLDLAPDQVRQITDLRDRPGAVLTTVEDLFAWTDLPYAQWDHIREHGLVLAVR